MKILNNKCGPNTPEFVAGVSNSKLVLIRNGINISIIGMMSDGSTRIVFGTDKNSYLLTDTDTLAVLD